MKALASVALCFLTMNCFAAEPVVKCFGMNTKVLEDGTMDLNTQPIHVSNIAVSAEGVTASTSTSIQGDGTAVRSRQRLLLRAENTKVDINCDVVE